MNIDSPCRVWINQPSKLQPLHKYHGKVGIAFKDSNDIITVYFTEGSLLSMIVPENVLVSMRLK